MKNLFILKQAALAVSAGLLLSACHSAHYDTASYETDSYSTMDTQIEESSGAPIQSAEEPSQLSQQEQEKIVIPLYEEQLNVGKQTVDAGQVTIRKTITTETVTQPVELRTETLVIEREPAGSQAVSGTAHEEADYGAGARTSGATAQLEGEAINEPAGAEASGAPFQERTFTIELKREQPMIQKNVVQTGRVVARKSAETEEQNVQQQVRRENVILDKSQTADNVEIRGNFETAGQEISEPAGAEPRESLNEDSSQIQSERFGEQNAPTQGQGVQDLQEQPDQLESDAQPEQQNQSETP